ncbi:PREDICTED: disintegrin and metalloproteinase domain-containing protein 33 [Bison bison bison]|uniref:Disintegrin and metalloproteinase domain-containing protein 33 n=1 Tax=Bison bison bison TaxID=43346 RepID=A0A6P3H711_BISBB|nr:PREDICTED: disintegrin and metalloproteinase domain-containing protein 33 [Bison bison bison]
MRPGSRRARGSPTWGLLLLLGLPWPVWGTKEFQGNSLGKPVILHWSLDGRPQRMVTLEEPVPKLQVRLVALEAEGQELLLELEKNHRLLAPGYTETHYSPDGRPVVLFPNHKDHCHYHGHVRGFLDSWVILSICSGMRGLITLSSNASYYVHPSPAGDSKDFLTHRIFRVEQLFRGKGTCGHRDPKDKRDTISLSCATQIRERRESLRSPRYLELYIVGDHTLFLTQHRNLNHAKQRLLEVANYVDQILRTLDIKVVLTGLEVWTEQDQSRVTPDANATLWAFLQWRRGLWARQPHDSAQLLTWVPPTPTRSRLAWVLGRSPLASHLPASRSLSDFARVTYRLWVLPLENSSCPSRRRCLRIYRLRSQAPVCWGGGTGDTEGLAGVLPARPTPSPVRRHPFPRVFSACSRRQLRAFFRKGRGACLSNAPDSGLLVPQARCGNGFVEKGEECDCGAGQECPDSCCLAHNCSLRAGAQCTHGECCAHCLLKSAGTPCRPAAGDCDLPEFCTGASPYCPPDIYLLDGSPCARGRGYCRDGACPTLEQQCQQLWGPGSRPAPEACFQVVNSAGDAQGNCGQQGDGNFVPCARRDAQCGQLQCQGGEQSALVPHVVPVDSTVHLGSREVTCRGASVLPGAQLDLPDLGLVEAGTQCGPRMVCQERRCQNTTFRELELCLMACHGRGVCNSNRNCHCAPGWAPPSCDKPGLGGSVDSGPVRPQNPDAFTLAMILSSVLPLLPGAGLAWCCCRRPGLCLQQCFWGSRRALMCSGSKDGPCRGHPLGSIHPMELRLTAPQESQPLDLENSARTQQPP